MPHTHTNNNPVNATDPTGHVGCSDIPDGTARDQCGKWDNHRIPSPINDPKDIKDDPVELMARTLLGEEGAKLNGEEEADVWGVAWAIRNRHDSGMYDGAGAPGTWYWANVSEINAWKDPRSNSVAKDPIGSGNWGRNPADAIVAYDRAREIAIAVLSDDPSHDITHGAIRWADAMAPLDNKPIEYSPTHNCTNCPPFQRTHFDNDQYNTKDIWSPWPKNSAWCVSTLPYSSCN